MDMDQHAVTVMVEDFWRRFMRVSFEGRKDQAVSMVSGFERQILDIKASLPTGEAEVFSGLVEAERERLFGEYNSDPDALRRRLATGTSDRDVAKTPGRSGSPSGKVAARAIVRTTIWESTMSIFRALRRGAGR